MARTRPNHAHRELAIKQCDSALDLARDLLWVDPPAVIWAGKGHHLSTWDPVDFHHTDLQSA